MHTTEFPEISELPSEPTVDYMRVLRYSINEDSEIRHKLDKIKHKDEDNLINNLDAYRSQLDIENGNNPSSGHLQKNDKEEDIAPSEGDPNAPKDKGHFVLWVVGLFGLVHVMPFIFLFQANEYWMYKFRNTTAGAEGRTYLQANFFSFAKIAITAPGALCTLVAAIGGHKIKAQIRIFTVLFIHSAIFFAHIVFSMINTDEWQMGFFVVALGLSVIMAVAMAFGGSGSMGLIAKLPRRYMKAQLVGEGASSIFSAIIRLLSIFITPSTKDAAIIYFSTGAILMSGTSIVFYFATQTTFFKYYTKNHKEERNEKIRNLGDFMGVFKILWSLLLLGVLPLMDPSSSIKNLVESEYKGINEWGDKYFVTICVYLVPSVTGVVGRLIFNFMDYDCSMPVLYVLVITREITFGCLTFLSNAQPRSHLPVILKHDWQFGLANVGNSLTGGFTTNLMAIKTMSMVPQDRIELSMMCNMFFTAVVTAATSPLGVLGVKLL